MPPPRLGFNAHGGTVLKYLEEFGQQDDSEAIKTEFDKGAYCNPTAPDDEPPIPGCGRRRIAGPINAIASC